MQRLRRDCASLCRIVQDCRTHFTLVARSTPKSQANHNACLRLPQGLAIGNGLTDPAIQYGAYR